MIIIHECFLTLNFNATPFNINLHVCVVLSTGFYMACSLTIYVTFIDKMSILLYTICFLNDSLGSKYTDKAIYSPVFLSNVTSIYMPTFILQILEKRAGNLCHTQNMCTYELPVLWFISFYTLIVYCSTWQSASSVMSVRACIPGPVSWYILDIS